MTPEQIKLLVNSDLAREALNSHKLGLLSLESTSSILKEIVSK